MSDDQLIPLAGVEVTGLGLTISKDISVEDWLDLGHTLAGLNRAMRWWIGDWLNYGEWRYGEMYAQAEAVTGFDPSYLANLKSIAAAIPISSRRELPIGHHQAVQGLLPEQQDYWLEQAEQHKWTRIEFRVELVKAGLKQTSPQTQLFASLSDESLLPLVVTYVRAKESGKEELIRDAYHRLKMAVEDKL